MDASGNLLSSDEKDIVNYRINMIVTALGAKGFPNVKIKMNSPNGDKTIVPYTYDNTSYLTKLKTLTKATSTSALSTWANPQNGDLSFISGFYNEAYKNTDLLSNPEFRQANLDFNLTLVFAKLSTPVEAAITAPNVNGKNVTYTITNKNDSRNYNKNVDAVLTEAVRYELFVLSNGAYFQNKIFDLFAIITKQGSQNETLFNQCMTLIDFMNNFARTDYFKDNVQDEYQFFTSDTDAETTKLLTNYYKDADIDSANMTEVKDAFNAAIKSLHDYYLIPESFTLATLFKVRRENILGYYTGYELDEDALTNYVLTNKSTKINYGTIDKDNEKIVGMNKFARIKTNGITYDPNSSASFNQFYITSGDMCIMVSELAQKYQEQQNLEYNRDGSLKKAIKGYLYYNVASMKFYEEEKLGRFTYTYENTTISSEETETNQKIDTWSKLRRVLSAIFNQAHEFDDTYINTLATTTAPTGQYLTALGTTALKSVLTIKDARDVATAENRIPIIKLNWMNEMPSTEVAKRWAVGIGIAIFIIADVALAYLTAGASEGVKYVVKFTSSISNSTYNFNCFSFIFNIFNTLNSLIFIKFLLLFNMFFINLSFALFIFLLFKILFNFLLSIFILNHFITPNSFKDKLKIKLFITFLFFLVSTFKFTILNSIVDNVINIPNNIIELNKANIIFKNTIKIYL